MKKVIRLKENDLHRLIKESVRRMIMEDDARLDKYGEPIPRGGQGWGVDPSMVNRQGYNQDGTKGPWFSRSCAVCTAVFINDGGRWYVLANQRGSGTPDYQGRWNIPCGYLDYNEDTANAAAREIREETGLRIDPSQLRLISNSSSPMQNRQNVCFYYATILSGGIDDYQFSTSEMEENEVSGIKWVPVDDIDSVKWAFDHDEIVKVAATKMGYTMSNGGNMGDMRSIVSAISSMDEDSMAEFIQELMQYISPQDLHKILTKIY